LERYIDIVIPKKPDWTDDGSSDGRWKAIFRLSASYFASFLLPILYKADIITVPQR